MRKIAALAILFTLASRMPLRASDIYGLPQADSQAIQSAFEALFNENFEKADEQLSPLKPRAEKYPLIQTAFVVRYWWEMASQVLETDPEASKPFTTAADDCLAIAEKSKKNKTQSNLSLATTLGLMSRWSAANRAWVPAYFRGKKAGEYARRTLENDKRAMDAYMTLGAFIYGKEKIRQSLSAKEMEENPDDPTPPIEGLSQLRKAYQEGVYFKVPAGLLLAGILTNEKPDEALPILKELRNQLPRSAFVHMMLITALYNTGQEVPLAEETEEFGNLLKENVYPSRYEPHYYFARGLTHFRKREWKAAEQEFKTASKLKAEKNPYVIWAYLYRGYALDASKRRDMAKAQYRKVLTLPRRFASHDHARQRLEKPFRWTDAELKKLEL
jgi:tetratricopeptide (TPR) repeat protein